MIIGCYVQGAAKAVLYKVKGRTVTSFTKHALDVNDLTENSFADY